MSLLEELEPESQDHNNIYEELQEVETEMRSRKRNLIGLAAGAVPGFMAGGPIGAVIGAIVGWYLVKESSQKRYLPGVNNGGSR